MTTTKIMWKKVVIGTANGRLSKGNVASQLNIPSRSQRHLVLIEEQKSPQNSQSDFTDTDGGVFGVRFFEVYPSENRCFLISPTSRFVWETKHAVAKDFKNIKALRGHNGFHAAWPESLENWTESMVDHHNCEVKALVKGTGDLIIGEQGWRAERCEILSVQSEKANEIAKTYGVNAISHFTSNEPKITWLVNNPEKYVHVPMLNEFVA